MVADRVSLLAAALVLGVASAAADGSAPLFEAIRGEDDEDVVRCLLDAGAMPPVPAEQRELCDLAILRGSAPVLALLLDAVELPVDAAMLDLATRGERLTNGAGTVVRVTVHEDVVALLRSRAAAVRRGARR